MTYRKKLIEVALPLDAINKESAREKSIRHGHPSTLHLWWARRPLAACRAVLFGQLVDDPSSWPEHFPTLEAQDAERRRIFDIIEALVKWENSNDEQVIARSRREIARSWARGVVAAGGEAKGMMRERAVLGVSEAPTAAEQRVINDYLATELPPVHDPFAGGGSIPLEAQRLGLRAIASDLNPVAVLINKALIEIPPRFAGEAPVNPATRQAQAEATSLFAAGAGTPTASKLNKNGTAKRVSKKPKADVGPRTWKGAQGLADDVRYYGAWMRDQAQQRIGHLYPQVEVTAAMAKERPDLKPLVGEKLTVIAWLWARTVASPDPAFSGVHVPLVSNFWLSTKSGKETWVEPVVDGKRYRFEVRTTGKPTRVETVNRGGGVCVLSNSPMPFTYLRSEAKAGRFGQKLLAVVAEGARSRVYLSPTELHEATAASARGGWYADSEISHWPGRTNVVEYGMTKFGDLFTPRQLVALTTFSDLVGEAREQAKRDAIAAGLADDNVPLRDGGKGALAYAEAMGVYLTMAVDKCADRNTTLCSWEVRMNRMRNTFGRQALPMVWDFAETNPFAGAGGDFYGTCFSLCEALDNLAMGSEGRVFAQNALDDKHACVVSTDPPYYDNIGYADLSDFFYVWMRRGLKDTYPQLFGTLLTPKVEELIASPYRHGGKEGAEQFFMEGMRKVLGSLARNTVPGSSTAIYYAFKQSEDGDDGRSSTGWETFLDAISSAGFAISATWPMRTELASRSVAKDTNALASSIVLACTMRSASAVTATRADFRRQLMTELPAAMRTLQLSGIAPVDLAQAAIGPGMAIYSKYSKVLESSGEPMAVRAALALINEILDEHLNEAEGEMDADSRFAVTWFEAHGFEAGSFGEAETLAKARAVSVAGLEHAGIAKASGGKVRLRQRATLPPDWNPQTDDRPTVWEATQHLIKRLEEHGEAAAAALLPQLGGLADAARDLAYRLYNLCERKKWAEEARAYNSLVVAWPELQRLAAQGGQVAQLALPAMAVPARRKRTTPPATKAAPAKAAGAKPAARRRPSRDSAAPVY